MSRVSQLSRLFRCIRWADVFILQGAPALGIAFSSAAIATRHLVTGAIFGVGSLLLMMHVFSFNDWADWVQQGTDNSATKMRGKRDGIPRHIVLAFSLSNLIASLLIFLYLAPRLFSLAAGIAALGIFYSHPSLNAKSMPVISTFTHLLGGMLYFLLGYGLFSTIDTRGILIGLFLGLTFAAGHPVQEVRDVLEDRHVGARTNAVVFGTRANFIGGLVLFSLEYFYLFALAWSGLIPRFLAVLPIVFYPIHIWWSVIAFREGLTFESIVRFQNRYRILYGLIGLAIFFSLFARH